MSERNQPENVNTNIWILRKGLTWGHRRSGGGGLDGVKMGKIGKNCRERGLRDRLETLISKFKGWET